MQPDSERFILLQDTQIYAAGLMVWHLLLNSTSSWIHMKRTFFFSSAAGAVTASRGLYGKAMDSFSFTKGWSLAVDGFLLLYKRLELGGFSWPRTKEEALEITPEQYQALMKGLEIVSRHPIQEVHPQDLL